MRNILILVFNDLAIAFKNKTFFLILFIPLFIFVTLNLIDRPNAEADKIKIGLVQDYAYAPEITGSIKAAGKLMEVTWVQNEADGVRLLKEHKIDGILTGDKKVPGSLALLVLKKEYLHKTEEFYAKHGGKTLIMARFVPIVRTFAPFVAGMGKMAYARFIAFCVSGAILWVTSISLLGFALGKNEWVKTHFELVVFGIIAISLLPILFGFLKSKFAKKPAA